MRVPGPRTFIRYVVLISLPSLVMFLYILTQTLPMALKARLTNEDFKDLPMVLTIPHIAAVPMEAGLREYTETEGAEPREILTGLVKNEVNTTVETMPQQELFPPGIWQYIEENLEDGFDLEKIGANLSLSEPIYEDPSWRSIESKFLISNYSEIDDIIYNVASTPSEPVEYNDLKDLHEAPVDPNMPTKQQLEEYLLKNYKINMERGFSRFSLGVTEDMIEKGPLKLPELLPNLKVPCWVEDVPTDFTYDSNIYHCHINNRRIKSGFEIMSRKFSARQSYNGYKWRIRCLPSFYLIGVAKCGTTDLFEAFTKHPQVVRPDLKEPEYWPYLRFGLNDLILNMTCARDKGRSTFAHYQDTFDMTSEMVKDALRKDENNTLYADVVFGDYSTHTFIDIFDWDKTLDAPDKINADHIYNVWPKSKFIIILRDPIDRAYSRYKMRLLRQDTLAGTPFDFHKRVLKQVASTKQCLEEYSERYCVYKATFGQGNTGTNALLNTGLYAIYMKDWLNVFPLEQFLIIKFEEYINDRSGSIQRITEFLGMTEMPPQYVSIVKSMSVMNAGREIGTVLPETRTALQDFYRPYNNQLVKLLGDEKFNFGY